MFGRWWLTADAAAQPRHAFGVGRLHVQKHMQAAWVQTLLSTMGRDLERRPFKHYYAKYAREAYPALGMGRELLSLNLSFAALCSATRGHAGRGVPGFQGTRRPPPLRYRAPDAEDHAADPRCTPRGDIPHGQLLQMPLLHNPMLEATPAERRATPAEEQEMLRWAAHGVTRVTHVLSAASLSSTRAHFRGVLYPLSQPSGQGIHPRSRGMHVQVDQRQPPQVGTHPSRWPTTWDTAGPVQAHAGGPAPACPTGSQCRRHHCAGLGL